MSPTTAPAPAVPITGTAPADRPLLTYYDDATGERTELTASALGSWAARTANLLRECDLGRGSRAAVMLPPHWQTAAVLLGAWSLGVAISHRPAATAGLAVLGPGADEPLDATFVSAARLDDWLEDVPAARHGFVLGLAPQGRAMAQVPTGYRDFLAEVERQADTPPAYEEIPGTDAASVDGTSYHEWARLAHEIAEARTIQAGDRVLIDAAASAEPACWLLAPLVTGASVVLCANLDPGRLADRVEAEKVTRVL